MENNSSTLKLPIEKDDQNKKDENEEIEEDIKMFKIVTA